MNVFATLVGDSTASAIDGLNGGSTMNGTWTMEQRQIVQRTIQEEVEDARLAHRIIPKHELPPTARAAPADQFDYATGRVDDQTQLTLDEPQELLSLTPQQAEDQDLSSAVVVIRRATQRLARGHDERVFRTSIRDTINRGGNGVNPLVAVPRIDDSGDGMLPATAAAVATLDGEGYRSGYVMVVGLNLYRLLHSRAPGAVDLPIVAVRGLLEGGPVHRSTVLAGDEGLVLSVGAGRIDRAVAVEPAIEFLRIESFEGEELRRFRLYERFITRFKETRSAVLLRLEPRSGSGRGARGGR